MNLDAAKQIAVDVCYTLKPYCEDGRIRIAGSIRRRKPDCGDIEVVCLPLQTHTLDMFGEASVMVRSAAFVQAVQSFGTIVKGKPTGRYCQIELPQGVKLDLFMPMPYDFWRVFAVRTGSKTYSHKVLASAWKRIGWCGTDDGLRLMRECDEKKGTDGKSTWTCKTKTPTMPPKFESEEHFFAWLEVPYIKPEERNW